MSKRAERRAKLEQLFSDGKISPAEYNFQIDRMKKSGRGHIARQKAERRATRASLPPSSLPASPLPVAPASPAPPVTPPTPSPKTPGAPLTKAEAFALAQRKAHEKARARTAALVVPIPFVDVDDFLRKLAHLLDSLGLRGHRLSLATAAQVDSSTIAKYLNFERKKRIRPSQPVLDRMVEWWRKHQSARPSAEPASGGNLGRGFGGATSLNSLPHELLSRVQRTARLRNVETLKLVEQILDRHLPSKDELDRAR